MKTFIFYIGILLCAIIWGTMVVCGAMQVVDSMALTPVFTLGVVGGIAEIMFSGIVSCWLAILLCNITGNTADK